jgi:hypothetical protein
MSEKIKSTGTAFTKQQFLRSAIFTPLQKDVLRTILSDDESYTVEQVHKMINDYAKRKVE